MEHRRVCVVDSNHESENEIYDFEDEISAKLNRNLEVNSSPFGS